MSRLKLFIPLVVFALLAGLFLFALKREGYDPHELPSALIGQQLPEFGLPTLESDQLLTARDITGEVMLINVWATWCPTCRAEHPYLVQLAQQGVRIIGLDYKDDRQQALQWLDSLGRPYAINLYDAEGRLGLDMGVYGAPETFLVDKTGVVRYKHVGVIDDKVWLETLKPLYDRLSKP